MIIPIRLRRTARALKAHVVYAGNFGGVAAVHVLDKLSKLPPSQDGLVALVYEACRSGKAPDRSDLQEVVSKDDEILLSLFQWPDEFWSALHTLWQIHQHKQSPDDLAGHRTHLKAGVSRAVALSFYTFVSRGERALMAGHGDPTHDFETSIRERLGAITLVLDRLPPKWESYIRRTIRFVIWFHKNPKENRKYQSYLRKHKLDAEYGLRVYSRNTEHVYAPHASNVRGAYYADDHTIVFYAHHDTIGSTRFFVQDTAHEIGHAIWSAAYSPAVLRSFLNKQYERSTKKLISQSVAADYERATQDFFQAFREGLNGLHMSKPRKMLKDLIRIWGESYPDTTKDGISMRALATQLNGYKGRFLTELVEENKVFLSAFDEHWAEGFTHVLLKHEDNKATDGVVRVYHEPPDIQSVPSVIINLIRHLLSL